jgi:hypothetical protein
VTWLLTWERSSARTLDSGGIGLPSRWDLTDPEMLRARHAGSRPQVWRTHRSPVSAAPDSSNPRILRFSLGTKVLTLPPARGNLSRPRGVIVDEGQNRRNTRLARVV